MLDSIKIVHDRLTGGEYRFLSDFFRFIGVFVFDCVMEESQVPTDYSAVIIIEKNISPKDLENLKSNYPNAVSLEEPFSRETPRLAWLTSLLYELIKKDNVDNQLERQREINDIVEAASIFDDCDLMKERNSYAYLYTNRDLVENARVAFLNAYERAANYNNQKNGEISRYFFFFRMEIIRCVNETCRFLQKHNFFDTKAVLNYIQDYITRYFEHSNFDILMGMLCELDKQYVTDAGRYFYRASEGVSTKAYGSFCYYKLGRYYEKIEGNWERAIGYYQKAYQLNSKSYRILYKIGMYYEVKKEPQRALDNYKRICEILRDKEERNYLQEKEYEYLYKTYFRMGEISREAKHYGEAIRDYYAIIELNKKLDMPNKIYEEIYGIENEKEHREATKKRLGLNKIYERLIMVYKDIGQEDKISEIMKKIKNPEEGYRTRNSQSSVI